MRFSRIHFLIGGASWLVLAASGVAAQTACAELPGAAFERLDIVSAPGAGARLVLEVPSGTPRP